MFVVLSLDPTHHAEAPDVAEIDGLEPKEAEIGKVDPVAAILVASEVSLPSASYIVPRHRFGIADHACSGGSKRIPIGPCLADESQRRQRTEGEARMLAGNRRQGGNRDKRHESPDTLSVGWLRQLRQHWSRECVLASCGFGRRHRLPRFSYGTCTS